MRTAAGIAYHERPEEAKFHRPGHQTTTPLEESVPVLPAFYAGFTRARQADTISHPNPGSAGERGRLMPRPIKSSSEPRPPPRSVSAPFSASRRQPWQFPRHPARPEMSVSTRTRCTQEQEERTREQRKLGFRFLAIRVLERLSELRLHDVDCLTDRARAPGGYRKWRLPIRT